MAVGVLRRLPQKYMQPKKQGKKRKRTVGYHWLVMLVIDGNLEFVSMAKTRKGAELSASNMPLRRTGNNRVIIVSADEVIQWADRGVEELEAMFKL